MNFELKKDGTIALEMEDDIRKVIDDFSEEIRGDVSSPASKKLFVNTDTAVRLNEADSEEFHSTVAKLLFYMKRVRPDIELPIGYLCTRVTKSTNKDWNKLKRVLGWLKHTIQKKRIIGACTLNEAYTWIDASYAVHEDMKGHTGGAISFGIGTINASARKQKVNTLSSTETEYVGVSEYIKYALWLRHFMKAQGYPLKRNVLYQDNMSAMKLEKNGRNSCTGNSRHVNIRYFFVKDRIANGEIDLEYCPTEEMLADYFTKPLQGALFRKFWEVIMEYQHISTLKVPKIMKPA